MNYLTGKYVNVILSVEEGKGMDFVKNPMHLTANFNNRLLESDKAKPEDRVSFNTELIWEIEKKDLRKIRIQNQPLRIECITTDGYNRTERVGFLLLSLRSAQVIPIKEAKTPVNYHWQKLVGCQADKKRYHPELYVALTVRDHLLNEPDEPATNVPFISEEEGVEHVTESPFPLTFLPDGFIRVGEDSNDLESISFNLLVREARNMDCLLPEVLVFKQNQERYYMSFKIFGVSLRTKPFYKELHDSIVLDEKVVVRMLSTQDTLEEFFKTQSVIITFFSGHDKLGDTEVDLSDVSFDEKEAKYYFKMASPNSNVIFGNDSASPYIDVKIWLKRSAEKISKILTYTEEGPVIAQTAKVSNIPKNMVQASGDQGSGSTLFGKLEKVSTRSKSECDSVDLYDKDAVSITRSVDTVVKSIPISPSLASKSYRVAEDYRKFIVELALQNLVWKKAPKRQKVVFKFLHPKAYSCLNVFTALEKYLDRKIPLNISVKMVYISTPLDIQNVLKAWPPKFVLTDEDDTYLCEELAVNHSVILDNDCKELIIQNKTNVIPEQLGKLTLKVKFNVSDFERCDEKSNLFLNPPIIDEFLTLNEVADVEIWKETQKENFEKHLEIIKEEEIARLRAESKEKRSALKHKLNEQVAKCESLQKSLQEKLDSIQLEKYLRKKRSDSDTFQEILKENLAQYGDSDVEEIIKVLSAIQRDNEYLRQLVDEQKNQIDKFENSTIMREHSNQLLNKLKTLEEQFEDVRQGKECFEEKWNQSYKDLEQINSEYEEQLQSFDDASNEKSSNANLEDVAQNSENDDTRSECSD